MVLLQATREQRPTGARLWKKCITFSTVSAGVIAIILIVQGIKIIIYEVCPKSIRPAFISPHWCYSSHGITQSFQNFNVIYFIDRLTSWSKFEVHSTLTIEKNNQHWLDMALTCFLTACITPLSVLCPYFRPQRPSVWFQSSPYNSCWDWSKTWCKFVDLFRSYPVEANRALWCGDINAGQILFGHTSYIIINRFLLHRIYGCSIQMVGAIWSTLTQCLIPINRRSSKPVPTKWNKVQEDGELGELDVQPQLLFQTSSKTIQGCASSSQQESEEKENFFSYKT